MDGSVTGDVSQKRVYEEVCTDLFRSYTHVYRIFHACMNRNHSMILRVSVQGGRERSSFVADAC